MSGGADCIERAGTMVKLKTLTNSKNSLVDLNSLACPLLTESIA